MRPADSWLQSWIRPASWSWNPSWETKAATILQFFVGLRGTLAVTFEEGTWLDDLLHSRVDKLVVCNPRKNALLKDGNKRANRGKPSPRYQYFLLSRLSTTC